MKTKRLNILAACIAAIGLAVFGMAACNNGNNKVTETVAKPTATPAAGTYDTARTVTLGTTTEGASIRYTTNGTDPTAATGTVYSTPVTISTTTTLKAIAYKTGWNNSEVFTALYTIEPPPPGTVATPTASPAGGPITAVTSVTLISATEGATIRYTTNGNNPTAASGAVYSDPISITETTTLKAIAYKEGMTASAMMTETYTFSGNKVATPTASPAGGPITAVTSVTLTTTTTGASIRYTTNGTDPTAASPLYATPIPITATTTVKAIAIKEGMTNSDIMSVTYTFSGGSAGPLTGTVTIAGLNEEGQILTAVTTALGGSGDITYHWTHYKKPGAEKENIAIIDTSSNKYTVKGSDIGFFIDVTVTRANNSGSVIGTLTGIPTGEIKAATPLGGAVAVKTFLTGITLTTTTATPITLNVSMNISTQDDLKDLLEAIEDGAKYVGLNLTGTVANPFTTTSGMTPKAVTGKTRVVSLTLPSSVNIAAGSNSTTGAPLNGFTNLSSVTLQGTVTKLNSYAFSGCKSLITVTLPTSIDTIGEAVFYGCTGLAEIDLSETVITSLGSYAFSGCTSLTTVKLPPSGFKTISNNAFEGCTSLAEISLPNTVERIGMNAFRDCTGLRVVICPATAPPALEGDNVFRNTPANLQIKVPVSLVDLYKDKWGTVDSSLTSKIGGMGSG